MYYVTLIWDESDVLQTRAAQTISHRFLKSSPHWQPAVDEDGLIVLCQPRAGCGAEEIYQLPGKRGVVLGKLFRRLNDAETLWIPDVAAANNAVNNLSESLSDLIAQDGGRHLISEFWGRYVAFLQDPAQGKRWVVRDPSGAIPCQRTNVQGISVYFVRIEDCEKLAPRKLSLNREFLVGYLVNGGAAVRNTPFHEVESILPGEQIEHHRGERRSAFIWNPLDLSQRDLIEDFDQAVSLTRRTVRACIHAWASCFDRILLSLSGGLDSSIVAACLKDAPSGPHVLARNFYTPDSNSDERKFARIAAKKFHLRLIEQERGADYGPRAIQHRVRSLIPSGWPVDPDLRAAEAEFFVSEQLQVEFRGHGGDELFFHSGSFATAVDYCWAHRWPDSQAFTLALEDAAFMGTSAWRVLKQVARFGFRRESWHMSYARRPNTNSLLAHELVRSNRIRPELWHPLFQSPSDIPPGKYEQAFRLAYGASCKLYDPLLSDESPMRFSPLFSQPLLELCLRIPLYVHRNEGCDRAVARVAFAEDLPPEIVSRQSKAYGTQRYRDIIDRNLDFVREMLLDGVLVREGLLNRSAAESALSERVSRIPAQVLELLSYMTIENWARAWQEQGYLAPAAAGGDRDVLVTGASRAAAS